MPVKPKLTRSKEKIVAGVCGGLAAYFGMETSLVRIGFVILGFITAFVPLAIIYLVMWFIVPEE